MSINEKQMQNKTKTGGQFQKMSHSGAKWNEVENTLADIKDVFGFVPTFFNNLTDQSLPGAWNEAKNLRFGTNTALDMKFKGLIGLAVSSQIPCEMINYFDQKSTLNEGATQQEQSEAITMAAITRHWSTVLNGSQIDKSEFRKEADKIMAYVKKMMEESHGEIPAEENFLMKPTTADETYKDIEKTLGLVPKFFLSFSKEGIAGAWSEFKGLQLNPHTALNGKHKELIGLAVAAQIPCDYCIYFHRSAAALNGASEREIQEAVSHAAMIRHWSAVFHSPLTDQTTFRKEADEMIKSPSQRRLQS